MSPEAIVLVIVLVALVVVVLSLALGLAIALRAWPWEVMRRGYADTLWFLPAWALPMSACWLTLTRIAHLPQDDAFWVTLALSCGIGVVAGVWAHVRSRGRAGQVLVDLGGMRASGAYAFQVVWIPLMFVVLPHEPATKVFCLPFGLLMGLWLWYCRESRVQVRENGLWSYTILRGWDDVEYVDWIRGGPRDDDMTLRLRFRHRSVFAPGKWCAVPMDAQFLPEVVAALRERGVAVKMPNPAAAVESGQSEAKADRP